MNLRSSGQPKNDAKTLFSTLHSLFPVIFATASVVAFVLLRNSRFSFYCYTQHEATPTQKSAWKWRCDLSRLLARKITKGIHSCKPTSLNRPVARNPQLYGCSKLYDLCRNCSRTISINNMCNKEKDRLRQTYRLWCSTCKCFLDKM